MIELIKAFFFGIIEGITEWLPISSTGHMILFDEFVKLSLSDAFKEMFLVVIQLGAILAVVILFWKEIWPFTAPKKGFVKPDKISMWLKIVVACIPAAVLELGFGDKIEEIFYNYQTVAIMLIVVGILFILLENWNKNRQASVTGIEEITYKNAFLIGIFQLVAAVFPGTSRSGATILGGLALGLSRTVAAEFTFYLAIPVMFGASFIKILKFGIHFSVLEMEVLAVGMITAFVVSVFVIKFLMSYIKKHDFKVFGWYRIVLGIVVLLYFLVFS
ncbi:MAG: undecaprenyl-diphosphate phosphatase [Butyribacter sp.]|nr:undecaprenyl-diphosphate phosphatase [bacterium]MDY3853476.1 undecaprenyl-diphosphate phosphatase [Butyribacter sp.]